MRRLTVIFALALLIVGLFAIPAVAQPVMDCTPAIEGALGWSNGISYQCKCTTVGWEQVCAWIQTGPFYSNVSAQCNYASPYLTHSGGWGGWYAA